MSKLQVTIEKIRSVITHDGDSSLEIAILREWRCVVKRELFRTGDLAVYFPIDSIIPAFIEEKIPIKDVKYPLDGKRIKTIKINGEYSQGIAVPLNIFPELVNMKVGDDVTDILGVKKWESLDDHHSSAVKQKKIKAHKNNPYFEQYTDIQHLRTHYNWFKFNDDVVVTEKLHGYAAKFAKLPVKKSSWLKKLFYFLFFWLKYEFCYGSKNHQLKQTWLDKLWKPKDIYTKVVQAHNIKRRIKNNEIVYGEIVGHNVQDNYHYGYAVDQLDFFVYDVQVKGKWLNHDELVSYCHRRGFTMVPTLYVGKFDIKKIEKLVKGPSIICAPIRQPVREGIVIRCETETTLPNGERKMAKWVSEEFSFENDKIEETGNDNVR